MLEIPINLECLIKKSKLDLMDVLKHPQTSDTSDTFLHGPLKYELKFQKDKDDIRVFFVFTQSNSKPLGQADFILWVDVEPGNLNKKVSFSFEKSGEKPLISIPFSVIRDPKTRYDCDGFCKLVIRGFLKLSVTNEIVIERPREVLSDALWNGSDSKDFCLIIGLRQIMIHKAVLTAYSEVFREIFEKDISGARSGKSHVAGYPYEVVEAALQMCYNQNPSPLTVENALLLLSFCSEFSLIRLKPVIEAALIPAINQSNVCKILKASLQFNATGIEKECSKFLSSCFGKYPVSNLGELPDEYIVKVFKSNFFSRVLTTNI